MASVSGVFKSIGHFFATAISKGLLVEKEVVKVADQTQAVVTKVAPTVEAIEGLVPVYGPEAVNITKAGEMVLGALLGVIHTGDDAIQQKLLDLGLDKTAIDTAVDVYNKVPTAIKTLVG